MRLTDDSVIVTGSGFAPDTNVTVEIHSSVVVLGTVTTDANGSFTKRFDIPCRVGRGEHTVTATAATGQQASTVVRLAACSREEHEPAPVAQPVVSAPAFTG